MLADALLHLPERVLHIAYLIGAVTLLNGVIQLAFGHTLGLVYQPLQGLQLPVADKQAEQCQQQQAAETDHEHQAQQGVVGTEDVALGANDGHTPSGILERMVENEVLLAVYAYLAMSDLARLHGYGGQMSLAVRIVKGIDEEGLMLLECAVGVDNQVSVGTQQRGMRVGEGTQREHQIGKPLHRDLYRQHAHQFAIFVV